MNGWINNFCDGDMYMCVRDFYGAGSEKCQAMWHSVQEKNRADVLQGSGSQ